MNNVKYFTLKSRSLIALKQLLQNLKKNILKNKWWSFFEHVPIWTTNSVKCFYEFKQFTNVG